MFIILFIILLEKELCSLSSDLEYVVFRIFIELCAVSMIKIAPPHQDRRYSIFPFTSVGYVTNYSKKLIENEYEYRRKLPMINLCNIKNIQRKVFSATVRKHLLEIY
jgi:hypothetical protein